MEKFDGELIVRFEFDGDFHSNNSFGGESSTYQIVSSVEAYTGEYEFTPVATSQTIAIIGKRATQNITINPIPSNYGLITWDGIGIRVS